MSENKVNQQRAEAPKEILRTSYFNTENHTQNFYLTDPERVWKLARHFSIRWGTRCWIQVNGKIIGSVLVMQ